MSLRSDSLLCNYQPVASSQAPPDNLSYELSDYKLPDYELPDYKLPDDML